MRRVTTGSLAATVPMIILLAGVLWGQEGTAPQPANSTPEPKPGAEILSDTMGVDFEPYVRRLYEDIQRNWDPLIPAEAKKPELKKGIVGIRFSILPDGRVGSMKLETRSGDMAFDRAAWYAITSEGQYPPLPKEFHGPDLELRVGFFYNMPVGQPKSSQTPASPPAPTL